MKRKSVNPRIVAAIVIGVVVLAGFYLLNPATVGWYPRCMFHALTGWHCPGCGTSRALHALLHGQFGEAFARNPLLFFLLPILAFGVMKPAWLTAIKPRWLWVLVGGMILFGLARNIPADPFTLLAP